MKKKKESYVITIICADRLIMRLCICIYGNNNVLWAHNIRSSIGLSERPFTSTTQPKRTNLEEWSLGFGDSGFFMLSQNPFSSRFQVSPVLPSGIHRFILASVFPFFCLLIYLMIKMSATTTGHLILWFECSGVRFLLFLPIIYVSTFFFCWLVRKNA